MHALLAAEKLSSQDQSFVVTFIVIAAIVVAVIAGIDAYRRAHKDDAPKH